MAGFSFRLSIRDTPSLYQRRTVSGRETIAETRYSIFKIPHRKFSA